MMNAWIPTPVAVVWLILFALIAFTHIVHAANLPGRFRLWHSCHVFMAAGMMIMFWPAEPLAGMPAGIGIWSYLIAAGVLMLCVAIAWWRSSQLETLWLVSVVDFAAMAYMFAMSMFVAWLSLLAATWFIAQTIAWASGLPGRIDAASGVASRTQTDAISPSTTKPPASDLKVSDASANASAPDPAKTGLVQLPGGRHDWSVRITLALMAAGMAYMILAMQFGMPSM